MGSFYQKSVYSKEETNTIVQDTSTALQVQTSSTVTQVQTNSALWITVGDTIVTNLTSTGNFLTLFANGSAFVLLLYVF